MTTETLVRKIINCLMEDRQAAGTAEFWEENMHDKSEEIFSRIWADTEVQSEEEKNDVKKIVKLTLTMMDADYTANANYTQWGVWEDDEGEIFSAYEGDLRWSFIASFDGVRFNVRELDEKFLDEDMEFCNIWDEFMMYWGDNAAEGYAEKVEDYFCDDDETSIKKRTPAKALSCRRAVKSRSLRVTPANAGKTRPTRLL